MLRIVHGTSSREMGAASSIFLHFLTFSLLTKGGAGSGGKQKMLHMTPISHADLKKFLLEKKLEEESAINAP